MRDPGERRDGLEAGPFGTVSDEITCRQFVELVTDYFEGALPSRDLSHIEEHLVICDWCVTYAEQMKTTVESLRSLRSPPGEQNAPEPPEAALAFMRQRRSLPR